MSLMAPFKGYEYNFRMKALNFDYIQLIWMCERFIHTDNAQPTHRYGRKMAKKRRLEVAQR